MKIQKCFFLAPILFGLQFFLLANLQFTAWPEMFVYPYLRNEGFLLYKDIIHPYPPLLSIILSAVYKIFGYDLKVLQVFSWTLILLSSFFVYLSARMFLKNEKITLIVLGIYVLLQPFLEGNMLWFDVAIVLPISIGSFFALRWINKLGEEKTNLFFSGFAFAMAGLIKQTAGIFPLLFLVYMLLNKSSLRSYLYFLLTPVFLLGLFLARIHQEGQIIEFWNWTLFYPLFHWSDFPGYVQLDPSYREVSVLFWICLPVLLLLLLKTKIVFDKSFSLIFLFLVGGLLAIYPRFSFFHFQTALVFLVLIYGYALSRLKKPVQIFTAFFFFIFLIPYVYKPAFQREWKVETRFYTSQDKQLAALIREKIGDGQKVYSKTNSVYFLGLPSQFYLMTNTIPPKPWTDNFGWYLEIPGVQEMVLSRWEDPLDNRPPDFIVWRQPSPGNWFDLGTYQPKKIVAWMENHYTKKEEIQTGIWLWVRNGLVVRKNGLK